MRSYLGLLVLSLTILTFSILPQTAGSKLPCKPCSPQECDEDPVETCVWGEARDTCGRRVCSKGPGERCGNVWNVLGICGEGMLCKSDERCHGCSIQTMDCYNGN